MRIPESEFIINSDGSAFHLHLKPEEVADNVILVGDMGRVALIAKHLTDIEFTRSAREFISTTGKYNGVRVTVISTGIGTDNCDIVMNELDALVNVDFKTREVKPALKRLNILRIGTSGAIQADIPLDSYVFAKLSLGTDGLMNWYGGRDQIAMPRISEAFVEQTGWIDNLSRPYFVECGKEMYERFKDCSIMGVTISAQGFYGPQGRVVRLPLAMPGMVDRYEKFEFEGYRLTNFEMESSAITGLGALLGHNCGTICLIIAQRHAHDANPDYKNLMEGLIELSLDRLTR